MTVVSRETEACRGWGWKVPRVLRDLMDCQVRLVLVRPDSRACEVPLGSKVGESEGVG